MNDYIVVFNDNKWIKRSSSSVKEFYAQLDAEGIYFLEPHKLFVMKGGMLWAY